MRRRKLLVASGGLAVALIAAGVFAAWPQAPDRITVENFHRVKAGMSRAEV